MADGLDWSSYKRAVDNFGKLLSHVSSFVPEDQRTRLQLDLFILKLQPQYILATPNHKDL